MSYDLQLLYSGSDGNAALLRAKGCAILIDAGRSFRSLCAALERAGTKPEELCAIFLTHEHRDHMAALDVFTKHYPVPVHITQPSADKIASRIEDFLKNQLVIHPLLFEETVGPFTLSSFPTPHDSEESVGYRITVADGDHTHTLGYATDLGQVTPAVEEALCGCEGVVLECNHDEEMLMTGPYPQELKRRIASRNGHLSNAACAAFCTKLAASGMKRLMLAHLSEVNNLPALALSEVNAALAGTHVHVSVASPDEITAL